MRMEQVAPMSPPSLPKQIEADRQTTSQRFPVILATTWVQRNGLAEQIDTLLLPQGLVFLSINFFEYLK